MWLPGACMLWFVLFVGCSAPQRTPAQAVNDPFFAQAPPWDASVMQRSEILSQQETDA